MIEEISGASMRRRFIQRHVKSMDLLSAKAIGKIIWGIINKNVSRDDLENFLRASFYKINMYLKIMLLVAENNYL
jgi:hypothetical protein